MKYGCLLFLVSCNFLLLDAQERISLFISDIVVNADATLAVQERIEVISEHKNILHGIVREFPTTYRDTWGTHYVVDFNVESVTHNGYAVPWRIESAFNGKKIYIGNEKTLVSQGKHVYVLTYTTNRQLGFFNDHDEIYWNVTGTGWLLPIDKVQARVQLPIGISEQLIKAEAYTGYQNEQGKNYSYTIKDNCIIFTTNQGLKSFEGITIVATFPKGFVAEQRWYQKIYWFFRDNFLILLIIIGLFLLVMLLILGKIATRSINQSGTVIPLFYPPAGMMPSSIGFLNLMEFNNALLSPDLVDLAVREMVQ